MPPPPMGPCPPTGNPGSATESEHVYEKKEKTGIANERNGKQM